MIHVIVNGKEHDLDTPSSIGDLLTHLRLAHEGVAVAINDEIVPRTSFISRMLEEGDRIELIRAVGGG